jgi:hypothetical protein
MHDVKLRRTLQRSSLSARKCMSSQHTVPDCGSRWCQHKRLFQPIIHYSYQSLHARSNRACLKLAVVARLVALAAVVHMQSKRFDASELLPVPEDKKKRSKTKLTERTDGTKRTSKTGSRSRRQHRELESIQQLLKSLDGRIGIQDIVNGASGRLQPAAVEFPTSSSAPTGAVVRDAASVEEPDQRWDKLLKQMKYAAAGLGPQPVDKARQSTPLSKQGFSGSISQSKTSTMAWSLARGQLRGGASSSASAAHPARACVFPA